MDSRQWYPKDQRKCHVGALVSLSDSRCGKTMHGWRRGADRTEPREDLRHRQRGAATAMASLQPSSIGPTLPPKGERLAPGGRTCAGGLATSRAAPARGRVGSEAAPTTNVGGPFLDQPTHCLAASASSADTSVRWDFPCLPHGLGLAAGSERSRALSRVQGRRSWSGSRDRRSPWVRGKAPRGLLQVGQQAAAQSLSAATHASTASNGAGSHAW